MTRRLCGVTGRGKCLLPERAAFAWSAGGGKWEMGMGGRKATGDGKWEMVVAGSKTRTSKAPPALPAGFLGQQP